MAKASDQNRMKTKAPVTPSAHTSDLVAFFQKRGSMVGAILLSLVLQLLIFPPVDFWPLAFVCFVPWMLMLGAVDHARRAYLLSYLLGFLFFAITMRWLFLVTIPGALILFAAMALYYPLVACPIRHVIRRRRLPLAVVFPAIWTGCEALRSIAVPRFPWCLLGHSQHGVLSLIQVSDLVGAYGVSFVVATVNGFVVDWILARMGRPGLQQSKRIGGLRMSAAFTVAMLAFCIGYGVYRLTTSKLVDGPRIAIIQGNYPNYVDQERALSAPTMKERADRYFDLVVQASLEKPDLFLLPETPWIMYLNREFLEQVQYAWNDTMYPPRQCFLMFRDIVEKTKAYLVTGGSSVELTPLDIKAQERRYNSAFVFAPGQPYPLRYDKIHLVFIGEYVPFRYGPLRFLYLFINRMMPFGSEDYEYSLTRGSEFRIFEMQPKSQPTATYRFATPICYENVMPYVSRAFVTGEDGRKRCDFLLNLSNDGWFAHSSEQPQHLAASVFRAIENRVGIARAVNTGISCFIDPDGRVHEVVTRDGVAVGPGVDGFRVANVKLDRRHTLYSRTGDVFAMICALIWGVFYLDYIVARVRESRANPEASL